MKKATVGFLAGAGSAVIMGLSWYATKRISQISGAYFAVTGKASTEYCDRICDSKGRTCREIGAINTWTQRKQGDEVFKEYRREYKKRFARINAGKLTKSVFYAWSEEARKKKEDCDNGTITPEDFSRWLKES